MIKLLICESVGDKYVFHEYRQKGDSTQISKNHMLQAAEMMEKELIGRDVVFIMFTSLSNPFNFEKEISHGKEH